MLVQPDHAAVAARVPALLRTLAGPGAPYPQQLAAIQAVVADRRRVLVVGGVVELVEPRVGAPGPEADRGRLLNQVTVAANQRDQHALAVQGL